MLFFKLILRGWQTTAYGGATLEAVGGQNMFSVYILKSERAEKYYVGYTSDIEDRLRRHNAGMNKSTKSGIPWKIVHREFFETKKDAWLRERKIKSYKGGEAFRKLIN